ncbi:hypothetical protein AMJ44_07130 [candidate division WOR-1 bacterium DG_54_3]|uniref:Uncharacterized protein n=1 Tax=candidate division WOR-1 bacterium DG_54_3 TaxID=1703775 RepID=A0A0S7XZZ2_UNCSA|nr:MAG: hypothetical protein AMJ44_07130 [candidate division WOR-1 bacterium DG_54_3]
MCRKEIQVRKRNRRVRADVSKRGDLVGALFSPPKRVIFIIAQLTLLSEIVILLLRSSEGKAMGGMKHLLYGIKYVINHQISKKNIPLIAG